MAIVAGFDLHRRQITYDALNVTTGEIATGRIMGFPRDVSDSSHLVVSGSGGRAGQLIAAVERDVARAVGSAARVEDAVCDESIELVSDVLGSMSPQDELGRVAEEASALAERIRDPAAALATPSVSSLSSGASSERTSPSTPARATSTPCSSTVAGPVRAPVMGSS